jgi:FdhD protein
VREDVGRHNAVDKVVGSALLAGELPLQDLLLVVSGRVSFEIVQKAVAAGVAGIVAVSAPSSLAVDLAREYGLLLAGLVRAGQLNVYAGAELVS